MSTRSNISSSIKALNEKLAELESELLRSRKVELMFNEAQRISSLGVWEYDIANDEITWTDEVYRIYDMDPSDEKPTLNDIFHHSSKEDQEKVEQIINNAIRNGESYHIDGQVCTKNGEVKQVHANGKPFFDQEGKLTHLFGTITDITERKEVEESLRFSDFTMESISDGIFWIDEHANFVKVNNAACKNLGYTREELLQMSGQDINPSFNKVKSQEYWQKTAKEEAYTFRTQHTRKDGSTFPVEITNNVIFYQGRELRCSIVRDITEQIRKEEEIQQALKEVKKLKDRLQKENTYLMQEIKLNHNFEEIVSESPGFRQVLVNVEQVANTDATVLITGESGTGKELLARAVHNLSGRRSRPLVKVNCAALPANLIESELFGHEKGAFTGAIQRKIGRFELADKGTIFLDEIGEMPLELQSKLLRVLQEGEFERLGGTQTIRVNVRVIAATNRDLPATIAKGDFREDLYYRLNVFPIESLPLRERLEDIPVLVNHFMKKFGHRLGKRIDKVPQKVIKALKAYDWPGNIRELENLIERAMIVSSGNTLELGPWLPKSGKIKKASGMSTLADNERQHIRAVLEITNGKIRGADGAAAMLDINPTTLEARIKKLGIRK